MLFFLSTDQIPKTAVSRGQQCTENVHYGTARRHTASCSLCLQSHLHLNFASSLNQQPVQRSGTAEACPAPSTSGRPLPVTPRAACAGDERSDHQARPAAGRGADRAARGRSAPLAPAGRLKPNQATAQPAAKVCWGLTGVPPQPARGTARVRGPAAPVGAGAQRRDPAPCTEESGMGGRAL